MGAMNPMAGNSSQIGISVEPLDQIMQQTPVSQAQVHNHGILVLLSTRLIMLGGCDKYAVQTFWGKDNINASTVPQFGSHGALGMVNHYLENLPPLYDNVLPQYRDILPQYFGHGV